MKQQLNSEMPHPGINRQIGTLFILAKNAKGVRQTLGRSEQVVNSLEWSTPFAVPRPVAALVCGGLTPRAFGRLKQTMAATGRGRTKRRQVGALQRVCASTGPEVSLKFVGHFHAEAAFPRSTILNLLGHT